MKKIQLGALIIAGLSTMLLGGDFSFEGVPQEVIAGENFTITIKGLGKYANYSGRARLITDKGAEYVSKNDIDFTNGTCQVAIYVTLATPSIKLICHEEVHDGRGESDLFTVKTGPLKRVQILAPGENPAPGTKHGKTGKSEVIAGSSNSFKIILTDKWWNPRTDTRTVSFSSTDPFAKLPSPTSISGAGEVSITLRTAAEEIAYQYVEVSAGGLDSDSSKIRVKPAGYTHLLLLGPGEKHVPGDDSIINYPGKQGELESFMQGFPYYFTIIATDSCWNRVWDAPPALVTVKQRWLGGDREIANDTTLFKGKADSIKVTFPNEGVDIPIFPADKNVSKVHYPTKVIVTAGVASIKTKAIPAEVSVGTPSIITATLRDAQNRPVRGVRVRFKVVRGDSAYVTLSPAETLSNIDGTATTTFTAKEGGEYAIEATSGGAADTVIITVKKEKIVGIWPNPYRGTIAEKVNIKYPVEHEAFRVLLIITDVFGNIVVKREYDKPPYTATGFPIITWDGRNDKGIRVASGLYEVIIKVERRDGKVDNFGDNKLIIIW